ncbi:MAG TPA: hypothetical protein VG326_11560, partial [Tepidisphaeraceae bacterium]|jgi:hypothetical protein|nr:hypothetical protein [Tepidisphaeraceae bacterium]
VVEEKIHTVQRQAIPGVESVEANRTFLSARNTGHFYLRLTAIAAADATNRKNTDEIDTAMNALSPRI